jgi:23S rRNA pseudouridine955/2504/2580 synthase
MAGIEHRQVENDEAGMRLDRWFKTHYPGLGFGPLQKLLRSGQVRVDGGRVKSDTRVQPGQMIRIPPMEIDAKAAKAGPIAGRDLKHSSDHELLSRMLLHEDDKVIVLNKPPGIAVQGGSGINRHIDQMLEAWTSPKGEKPRLVHRLDRDTSGVLVIARTRGAAQKLTAAFRERDTKKTYWSLVMGVPKKREDKISTWLVKEQTPDGDRMRIAKHGEDGADHAVSFYRIIEQAAQNFAWLEMEPYTGRTHQLRVHAAHMGHPIIGDPKYFEAEFNWAFPGGVQNKRLRVTAPMPAHMVQTWNLFGFDMTSADEED